MSIHFPLPNHLIKQSIFPLLETERNLWLAAQVCRRFLAIAKESLPFFFPIRHKYRGTKIGLTRLPNLYLKNKQIIKLYGHQYRISKINYQKACILVPLNSNMNALLHKMNAVLTTFIFENSYACFDDPTYKYVVIRLAAASTHNYWKRLEKIDRVIDIFFFATDYYYEYIISPCLFRMTIEKEKLEEIQAFAKILTVTEKGDKLDLAIKTLNLWESFQQLKDNFQLNFHEPRYLCLYEVESNKKRKCWDL